MPARHFFRWRLMVAALAVVLASCASKPVAAPEPERERWVMAEAQDGASKFIARILDRAPSARENRELTRLLRVTWRYASTPDALPAEAELRKMAVLEDDLGDALGEGDTAKLVLSETGGGTRMWMFYVSNTVNVDEAIRKVGAKGGTVFESSTAGDRGWAEHQALRRQLKD